MAKHYFSFGQAHVHRIDGVTLDADCLLMVEDDDAENARQRVWDTIGAKWAMQYSEDRVNFKWFPRGEVIVGSI